MNNSDINFNDVERQDMLDGDLDKEIQEEMLEEAKEEQAIFNKYYNMKYYNMLTEEEKFDLAEEEYLDENSFDDYWYLKPKFVVESRRKKGENNE